MAQRFALRKLQLEGEAFLVTPKIARSVSSPAASFSASDDGVLLTSATFFGDQLTWFDRAGKRLGKVGNPGLHFYSQLSPDEQTLVFDEMD